MMQFNNKGTSLMTDREKNIECLFSIIQEAEFSIITNKERISRCKKLLLLLEATNEEIDHLTTKEPSI